MLDLTETPDGVILPLKVVPGASRDRIVGEHGSSLKVTVAAPPEKGKANKAIIQLLAKALDVRPNRIEVVKGGTSPDKAVLIRGTGPQAVRDLVKNA